MTSAPLPGLLEGIRVVELSAPHIAFAGKLLADMGADVVVVEGPGGDPARRTPPVLSFGDGAAGSVWWEHYATSKRSVIADPDVAAGATLVERLIRGADIVLEGEPPGHLEALGLGPDRWCAEVPSLVWTSITSFGHADPRSNDPFSDLTILAEGGPVWSCGYDDHRLPPVRGRGNQGFQLGCLFAAMATLTAVIERARSGLGQHVDVSLVAAANVSTEMASYGWLVAQETVQRLTGRHAMPYVTTETQVAAKDGAWVQTGIAIREPSAFAGIIEWLMELDLLDDFHDAALLELGASGDLLTHDLLGVDALSTEIVRAGRDAVIFIAGHLTGYEFFTGAQRRGLQCGVVLTPEQVLDDPHLVSRGWPVELQHSHLRRPVRYPGPWFRSSVAAWSARPAPRPGEHHDEIVAALDGDTNADPDVPASRRTSDDER